MLRSSLTLSRPSAALSSLFFVVWSAACGDIDRRNLSSTAPCSTPGACEPTGGGGTMALGGGGGTESAGGTAGTSEGGTGGASLGNGGGATTSGAGTAGAEANAGSGGDGNTSLGGAAGAAGTPGAGGTTSSSTGGMSGDGGNAGAPVDPNACPRELLGNGGFEAGLAPWLAFTTGDDPLDYSAGDPTVEITPFAGQRMGWLGGVPSEVNRLSQEVTLPTNATSVTLGGAVRIQIFEPHALIDFLRGSLVAPGQRIPIFERNNGDATEDWVTLSAPPVDIAAFAGQTLTLELESEIGVGPGTNFFLDDLSLIVECGP